MNTKCLQFRNDLGTPIFRGVVVKVRSGLLTSSSPFFWVACSEMLARLFWKVSMGLGYCSECGVASSNRESQHLSKESLELELIEL